MGASEVVYRSTSRYNGWSCPPHAFQFVAWGSYIYFAVFYFTSVVPSLLDQWQPAAYVVMAVFFVIHIVVHLLACSINPADPGVLQKMKKGKRDVGKFDRTQHRHVIENQHCYLCEVDVGSKSKHCSTCNKCVAEFDHHCKWLNNCVGGRNYRLFIATLASAIAGCLTILIVCLVQFGAYYRDRQSGHILKPYKVYLEKKKLFDTNGLFISGDGVLTTDVPSGQGAEFQLFYTTVPHIAWQVLIMFTVVLATLSTGLLGHLLGFHIYLMCRGLNTYDYIIQDREKSEKAAREKEVGETQIDTIRSRNKHNRVRPDDTELTSRRTSRGGIDEHAVVESSRLSPAPTPPPPMNPRSYKNTMPRGKSPRSMPNFGATAIDSNGHRRRKKKKSRKPQTPAANYHGNSNTLPRNQGLSSNGHVPREASDDLDDDLKDVIRKSLDEKRAEGILSDDTIGPSSVKDVAVAVAKKKKKPTAKREDLNGYAESEEIIYPATDSGCEVGHGSPEQTKEKSHRVRCDVLPPAGQPGMTTTDAPPRVCHSDHSTEGDTSSASDSERHSKRPPHPHNIHIEKLNLPVSSDSDYEGSNCKRIYQEDLKAYSPRGYDASSATYHTLPSMGSRRHISHHWAAPQKANHDDTGSEASLHEIPVSHTQHGARQNIPSIGPPLGEFQRSASLRGFGPEIGHPSQGRAVEHSKKRRTKNHGHGTKKSKGVINRAASVASTEDEQEEEICVISPRTAQIGNKLVHTVEIYTDVPSPRPPRHKDVPPLDLSHFQESDADLSTRQKAKDQASQI